MTNTEGLDNMNFDVLTEIGNIGAGQCGHCVVANDQCKS